MIQRKHAIDLRLLLAMCSCSTNGDGNTEESSEVTIGSTAPGVIQGGDVDVLWVLSGDGFVTGAKVTVDVLGATVANTIVVSATQITFTLSAPTTMAAGTALVTVANLDGGDGVTSVPTVPEFVTLSASVQPIFTQSCALAGCHTGGAPAETLNLSTGLAHGNLFNVDSVQAPGLPRVTPGDSDFSYIVDKLEGFQNVGGRMPLGAPALDATSLQLVRKWIEAGALDD